MAWTTATTRSSGFAVTAAVWNSEHVDNMNFLKQVNRTDFTADVSITTTAIIDIVSSGAITYTNVPHIIEFSCPRIVCGASGALHIKLQDGATDLGIIFDPPINTTTTAVHVAVPITPSAASHTYKITGTNQSSQTSTVRAGAGGAATYMPGFIRIFRIPT
jgi:hypothetical protein